ncbi:MAG: glycosyltransferase [Synechococcus sp.]|nr:glycosyltransferase [Synechococcus sp.]
MGSGEFMLVSVLTPCLENPQALAATLASILTQCLPPDMQAELIVLDGSCSPHCRREAERQRQALQQRRWRLAVIARPARGIYDALNVALQRSVGRWLQVLPAGDRYADPHSLMRLLAHADQLQARHGTAPAAVFGQAWVEAARGRPRWLTPDPRVGSIQAWLQRMVPCHQAVLFAGSWARAHPYPETSRIYGDRPVMRAALAASGPEAYLPLPVCRYRLDGLSSGLPDRQALQQRLADPALGPAGRRVERIKAWLRRLLPAAAYPQLMRIRAAWLGWRC